MNVSEILITVGLTVAAAVVIAYTTFKVQTKHRERALFRALLDEVKLNLSRAQVIKSRSMKDMVIYPGLRTEAYDSARLAGVLLSLKEDVREKVHYPYEMIIMHNREISVASGQVGASYDVRLDRVIRHLELLENELSKKVRRPTKRSDYEQQDLLRQYIMSQVPTFLLFGLFSIYAYYLSNAYYLSKLVAGANISKWDWGQHIVGQALVPIGIFSIAWAIILFIVGLSCKMPKPLEGMREKITGFVERKSEPIVYVASITVFGLSFTTAWATLSSTDINRLPLFIIFCIGLALVFGIFVNNMLRARHQRARKTTTKNDSETQGHSA